MKTFLAIYCSSLCKTHSMMKGPTNMTLAMGYTSWKICLTLWARYKPPMYCTHEESRRKITGFASGGGGIALLSRRWRRKRRTREPSGSKFIAPCFPQLEQRKQPPTENRVYEESLESPWPKWLHSEARIKKPGKNITSKNSTDSGGASWNLVSHVYSVNCAPKQ